MLLIFRSLEFNGVAAFSENLTTSLGRTPVAVAGMAAPQLFAATASIGIVTVPLAIVTEIAPLASWTANLRSAVNVPLMTVLCPPPVRVIAVV